MMVLSDNTKREVATKLVRWFNGCGRRFPWRFERDPYKTLVVEILLQRTRADAVNKIYREFFETFPTITSLARCEPERLNQLFSKLGLVYRGRRLKEIAKEIVARYGGEVPRDMDSLLRLKGVGVYVASAVLNFAHGIPTPVIDRNVLRVLDRHISIVEERAARKIVAELYEYADHRKLAYALIDVGSLLCLDSRCQCPLADILPGGPLHPEKWRLLRKVSRGGGGTIKLQEQPISRKSKRA